MGYVAPPAQELDKLLAAEDYRVSGEAATLLAQTVARVGTERLSGLAPSGAPVYELTGTVDGVALR